MRLFKDSKGQEWTVAVTIGSAKRVLDLVKVDLLAPLEGKPPLVTRLQLEVYALVDVLFALVRPQADERGVSGAAFAELMDGEASYAAYAAFMEDWSDFFRQRRQTDVVKAIEKNLEMVRRATELSERVIEAAAEKVDEALTRKANDGLGKLSGDLLESLESTPAG